MNVLLTWIPTTCPSPYNQSVEYKKRTDSVWTVYAKVPCSQNMLQINGLEDNAVYEFRVGSKCSNGSLDSILVYSDMSMNAKIGCASVMIDTITDNSVSFTLTPLGNDVVNYLVQLLDFAGNVIQSTVLSGVFTGQFTNLIDNQNYSIKVTASTVNPVFLNAACDALAFMTPLPDCSNVTYDILFVNDESGSVGNSNYQNIIKPGILEMVEILSGLITTGQIRIGIIGFASNVFTRLDLSGDYFVIYNTIQNLPYANGGTATPLALQRARELLTTVTPNHRVVAKKVILITDGAPTICLPGSPSGCSSLLQTEEQATLIKNSIEGGKAIEIITVGVANANNTHLANNVATAPNKHYTAPTFADFQLAAIDVANNICLNLPAPAPEPCYPPLVTESTIIEDIPPVCEPVIITDFTIIEDSVTVCEAVINTSSEIITDVTPICNPPIITESTII